MKTLLVTGPIGGGKSSVCRHMQSRGIPVYDCDSRTKRLYSTVPGLKERIEAALGIRWDEIGSVFSSPEKLSALASELGIKVNGVFQPIRVAITNSTVSLPLFDSIRLLGMDRTEERLERAKKLFEEN